MSLIVSPPNSPLILMEEVIDVSPGIRATIAKLQEHYVDKRISLADLEGFLRSVSWQSSYIQAYYEERDQIMTTGYLSDTQVDIHSDEDFHMLASQS